MVMPFSFRANADSEDFGAISRSNALVWFEPDGTITKANQNFCDLMGYTSDEIVGRHHRLLVDSTHAASVEYEEFWSDLKRGKFIRRQFARVAKSGKQVWIEASYNPILKNGKVVRVLKVATDITASKTRALDDESKLGAISRSQAVIEFTPDGSIIDVNDNFLAVMGYGIEEIVGRHHRMFCSTEHGRSVDYARFWQKLRSGEYLSGTFDRYGKGGKPVWLQASYNPMIRAGKVMRIIKIASDITSSKVRALDDQSKIAALNRAQAIIEFTPDGHVIDANANYLQMIGYELDEIKGRHHRMFCDESWIHSSNYHRFWQRLRLGERFSDVCVRYGKNHIKINIKSDYNPMFDEHGEVYKIVKFASPYNE